MHANLIYLGDLRLTVSLAGAVSAWLLAAHLHRLAFYWCIAVGSALGAVATSKIIYLVWGLQLCHLDFKAASGHAAGAAAVYPVVVCLGTMSCGRNIKYFALLAGWGLSIAVASALIGEGEHSPAEAVTGWCSGALASACTCVRLRETILRPSLQGVGAALAATLLIAFCMQALPVGWWIIKTALLLSGGRQLYPWND